MSYDISFRVKVESVDRYVDVGNCDANITWNLRDMITKSTGLEWKNEENNGLVKDVIPYIVHGLNELLTNRAKYSKYNSPNGWGTIDGCIHFFRSIVNSWYTFLEVDPELAEISTFWIV